MAENEAHLEIGIDAGNAISAAERIEQSLKRLADNADKALASLKALDNFRGKSSGVATGVPRAPSAAATSPTTGATSKADIQSAAASQRLASALAEATRSSQAFARAAVRVADAASNAAAALRSVRTPPAATTARPVSTPPPVPTAPVAPSPLGPSAPVTVQAPSVDVSPVQHGVSQIQEALLAATRSVANYARSIASAADAAARASAVFNAVRAPAPSSGTTAPPTIGASPASRPPAPSSATPTSPAPSSPAPTHVSVVDTRPIQGAVSQIQAALLAATRSIANYARSVSSAAEAAIRAGAAFRSVSAPVAAPTVSPAVSPAAGIPGRQSAAPATASAAPPSPVVDTGDVLRGAERLGQALSVAARSAESYSRIIGQLSDAAARASAALRSVRSPSGSGTAGVGTPGTAAAGTPPGSSSGGTVPPTLQALTVALGQAAATVGTAGQILGQTMQAAGGTATAFAQAAQRAAAILQTTTGRPATAAGGSGGGRGGGVLGGATIGAAAGGSGGAATAAQGIARQSQAAAVAAQRSSATISSAFEKIHNSVSSVTERVMSLRTAFVALGAGMALRSLAETGMQFESLTKAMNVVTGDSAVAKQEMARLREETDRLGLVTSSVADDYLRFLASIKGSSIDANAAKDAFFGVAQAMSLLGKGEEQTNRALKAIEQIASKGQVYAEELKQQLGDQLPGAINTAATAMGYSVERMFQEMEKGTVSAEEFFAVFNKELQIRFPVDRMDSARASVNRLTNAWVDFQNLMANSGFLDAWADAADRLADKMNSIEGRVLAQEIGEVLGKAIRATADAMIWLADNADKVKIALLSIIGIQIVGFLTGVAGAALKTAGAFKVLWAAAGMSGLGRIARGVGAVAGALGLGAAAAGLFGDETGDVSSEIQGAENAIDSYYEKLKAGKSATDDMTEAQRDLAIEMTKTAIAAEQSKLDKMQGERKQLLEMVAPERPPEWKEEALGHTLNLDKPEFSGNEIAMEFNRIGEEADKVAGNVEKLSEKLKFLEDDAAIAARQKPKQPEQRKDLLPPLPKGGSRGGAGGGKRSTESYFEEQKAELDAQIQAEQSITAAYGQGAEAVEKQRRELEILRKVQKLKFEFNPKQVAELEQRIRALADATDQTAFKGSGAAIDDETQKIQRLTEARAESGEALSQQEAQEQARSEAASKGILHVAGAVETLTAKYLEQGRARDEASNVEATEGYENEVQAIERMIGAMDLEGIARTRRIAELQEEARMIQENIDLNSASARARIEAAGAVAVADMSAGVRRESEELQNQINTTTELSGAMAVYGEQRIREMAEIEMRNNLLARGADMTDANTEATIRFAGESAVLTNRLERQNDALDQLANSGLTFNEQMRSISADGLGHMEDALVDIITGTKSVKEAFADMARSIAADLARMAVRQAITIPIAMAMNSMFMGPAAMAGGGMGMAATGMPVGLYHTGGVVGKEMPMARAVDPGIFATAPRFHAGTPDKLPKLASNEMPAVLKKDEGVFTPAQMQALGPAGGNQTVVVSPTINVNQPPGATEDQGQRFGRGIMREIQGLVDERINRAFKPGGIRNQTGLGA